MDHEKPRDFDLAIELFAQVDSLTRDVRPDICENSGNQDHVFIPSKEQLAQAQDLFEMYGLDAPDELSIVKFVILPWIDIRDQVHAGYEAVWIGLTRNSVETEYAVTPDNTGRMVLTKDGRLFDKKAKPHAFMSGVEVDTLLTDPQFFEAESAETHVLTEMLRIFGASGWPP
ncbi:MAG TPA: hypothetical protein VLG11_00810 [Candidatus Saccharimonadales bacterium]|nr:hypothetical protein [Candidatus Saccharimonadales bacterium]